MKSLHTFVICAYKEVLYLEECVKSLKAQTQKSKIIISTSTSNDYIKQIAKKYGVELKINLAKSNHLNDFCFAYKQANTKYVTLCHQDDIYLPEFSKTIVKEMEKEKDSILLFANYYEFKNEKLIKNNFSLFVKRILNFPLKFSFFRKKKKVRKLILSLGNPICAPTVTYNKEKVKRPVINSKLMSNVDWDSWIELAKYDGSYIYINTPLLWRRIHLLSLTTDVLNNKIKQKEDYEIFRRFWPKWIAKILVRVYSYSERNYKMKKKKKED